MFSTKVVQPPCAQGFGLKRRCRLRHFGRTWLQKYTFSLKQQIFGADFLKNRLVICLNIRPSRVQSGACSDFAEPSRMSMERSFMKFTHANYANCKLRKLATSQSVRNSLHSNPHLAPLVGLCSVSAGYLIGGWASSPILIIRHLAFIKSARLYVFQNPKSWQNSYLLAICVVCVSIFSCKQSVFS